MGQYVYSNQTVCIGVPSRRLLKCNDMGSENDMVMFAAACKEIADSFGDV